MASWQIGSVLLAAAEGTVGLWLSVKTNAPPGATIATLSGAVFGIAAVARAIGPRRGGLALAGAVGARCSSPVAGARARTRARSRVVATTTQIGDFVRQVGGDAWTSTRSSPRTPTPTTTSRARTTSPTTADAKIVFTNGDNLDSWMDKVVEDSGSDAKVVDLGATVPVKLPGESSGPEASQYDPHWWHDPRNAEEAVRQIAAQLSAVDPADKGDLRGQRRRLRGEAEAPGLRDRELLRRGSRRRPQAGHRPRRVQLLREPLRDPGRRGRHPLPDHPGAAERRRTSATSPT